MAQEIPCIVEISSPEQPGFQRSGIDVICVIDVSSSMAGDKLELVKKTLLFMIKMLDITDRVSLITFSENAKQKSGLICMNEIGKAKLSAIVNSIQVELGTDIFKGLMLGFDILELRSIPNQITSVILLSDGVDTNASTAISRLNSLFNTYFPNNSTNFTIHTFGYGKDHQTDLLSLMARKTNGGFYYVEQEKLIPQAFSDCLGEMMSVVADSVQVKLSTLPARVPFSISRVYSETGDLTFRMPPILAGEKKEAVFLVSFLPAPQIVNPKFFETLVKGEVQFKLTANAEVRTVEAFLRVHIVKDNEKVDFELDEDVMVHFYRAKCADVLKEAARLGKFRRLQEAKMLLFTAIAEFSQSVVASNPIVTVLIRDLKNSAERCEDLLAYENGGNATMESLIHTHQNKRVSYKNSMQSELLSKSEKIILEPLFK